MFQPKSFRIILLSIFCLSIGIVFAAQLPIVNGENDISKQSSTNLLTTLLPTPIPTPDQTPHTLVGSFYTLQNNLEAKLLLNNKGNTPLEVHPTLYNLQGLELQLSPVTVEPQSFRFINLSDWAAIGGESFRSGNIKLFHTGKDLVLGAQIYLTDETRSLSYEEKLTEKGKFDSRRQEAVWWMPSNDAKVKIVLTNTTDVPLSITGKLAKKPNIVSNPQTIQLAAHQTRVFDLIEDFPNGNQFANAELLALSLEHSGANDALLARVLLAETQRGFSNVVQFSNPNGGKSSEYQGVGFQIENINGLQFAPIIVARNVGTTTATINTKVPYTRINGTRGTITLPQKQLSAGEIGLIDTRNIVTRVQQEQIKVASLEVKYNTTAGSVIVASHSVSTDGNQVFRVPMWDPLGQRSPTGGYPWRVEGTSQTETYIKNITDQEQDYVAFLVWENGGMYMIGLKPIAAYETIHIDVKKLRDEQIPDERGRTIPLYLSSGQLQWTLRRKDNLPDDDIRANLALIGRSEQVDITKGITNNYACQNCCSGDFISGRIEAADLSQEGQPIAVGSSRTYLAVEEQQTCYGFGYEFTSENVAIWNAVWTSSNYNVANVVQGNVTGVGGGQATIQASWYPYSSVVFPCPPQGGGNPLLESSEENCQDSKKGIEKTEEEIEKTEDETSTSNFAACGQCQRRRWSNPYTAVKYITVESPPPTVTNVTANGATRITQILGDANIIHFVTPRGAANSQVTLTATLSQSNQQILDDISWEGATESATNPLQATVPKSAASRSVVKIKYRNNSLQELRVWVVWSTIASPNDFIIEGSSNGPVNAIPSGAGYAIRGGYAFNHTINPTTIITDANRPNFSGGNTTPAPGGNHPFTGTALSGGANTKWDVSRQMRANILNPANIANNDFLQPPFVNVNYPANNVEGNDDALVLNENNDPYTNNGILTDRDRPIYGIVDRAGANGDTYEAHLHFRQFTRLEIEGTWTRISDDFLWRIHLNFIKVNGFWENNGSNKALDNAGF